MRKIRRAVSLILSVLICTGLFAGTVYGRENQTTVTDIFEDVIGGKWYVEAVQYVYDNGIMVGSGSLFKTNSNITREEFTQVLYGIDGKPEVKIDNPYKDVRKGWYLNSVLWAKENGIADGKPDGTFGVGKPIFRKDLVLMLYKFAVHMQYDLTKDDTAIEGYQDTKDVPDYAKNAMNWAVSRGIISGKGNGSEKSQKSLDPSGKATRAECAAMIMKMITANEGEKYKVGDSLIFGKYEQDGDDGNGKEDIEWVVLDVDKDAGRILVISKYALDCRKYHETETDITWENCSLRTWMNNDFYLAAFDDSEQSRIPTVLLENKDNPIWKTGGGNSTQDKVFCLSQEEVETYIKYDAVDTYYSSGYSTRLLVAPTQYALNNGAIRNVITEEYYNNNLKKYGFPEDVVGRVNTYWWLRSPGSMSFNAGCVFTGYTGSFFSYHVNKEDIAVRPAIYIVY